jgi:hypothetical protein
VITSNKLRAWQLKPANRLYDLLKKHDSVLDRSICGAGKTYISVAIIQALGLPCLVVCPKISISSWKTVLEYFGETASLINYEQLRTGKSLYGTWANQSTLDTGRRFTLVCQCCQRRFEEPYTHIPCVAEARGIHCFDRKPRPIVYGRFKFHDAIKFLVFDEAHRCGGIDSLNADMLVAAKRQRIKHLMLTATPAQTILHLKAIGYSLDMHCLDIEGLIESKTQGKRKVWSGFLAEHGAKFDRQFNSWKWWQTPEKQKATMDSLRDKFFAPRGICITEKDIPNFPQVDIQAELIDTENEKQIRQQYEYIENAVSEIEGCKLTDTDPDHPLTKILRARQTIELLKVPATVERARARMEQGFSVGVFCNFRQSLEILAQELQCPFIDGTIKGAKRDEAVSSFQENKSRSLVLNSEVAGISIGLQDLDGNFPRFGLVMPPWSALVFKQLAGRFPRDGGKSKSHYRVLVAANTIEMKVFKALNAKIGNLDALTDSDLQPVKI